MSDHQSWMMSVTVISVYGLTVMYSLAKYAIMRTTERYISAKLNNERDQ